MSESGAATAVTEIIASTRAELKEEMLAGASHVIKAEEIGAQPFVTKNVKACF